MSHATKLKLIETGLEIMLEKGFHHTGLQEVLRSAGVPKGSFYHFFRSKEDFCGQVLQHYAEESKDVARSILCDQGVPPLLRIRRYFEMIREMCHESAFSGGCLIGNLTQELGDQNACLARVLEGKWQVQKDLIAEVISQAQERGEVAADLSSRDLADFLINSWQGAMMRMKVNQSSQPLDQFLMMIFTRFLV